MENKNKSNSLQRQAEEPLLKTPSSIKKMSAKDPKDSIEELQIHQAALEIQNEELRRAQLELEAARDKYSDLYDFAPVGYFTISEKGIILDANLTMCTMLGMERGLIIGNPFIIYVNRDDQHIFYHHHLKLMETKDKQTCELRIQKKDKFQFHAQMECIPVLSNNVDLDQIRISLTDITARKQAEEALLGSCKRAQQYLDIAGVAFIALNTGGELTLINKKGLEILGYREEELLGKNWFKVCMPARMMDEVLDVYHQLIRGEIEPVEHYENPVLRKDGTERIVAWHNSLLRNPSGEIVGILSSGEDITERKQAEEALQESTKKIKLFAYSVSHDLRSPAISIYGLTKRLSKLYRNILDEKGKTYCDQILKASEQIAGLAQNINVYISTKEAPMTIENVDLGELFHMVREEIAPQLRIRNVRWSQAATLPQIKADRLAVVRVIRNLVDNALKYGGDDLSEINIGYQESDESHILSVMDDGIGLKEGDSKDIFDIFKRTKTSRGIEGAGLGLAIVKEIAERHGGKIWIRQGTEKGIEFRVSISKYLQLSH